MRPLTILLIEDEPVIACHLKQELENAGHQVREVSCIDQAEKEFSRLIPVLVILNFLRKNPMDGMALARRLRTCYPAKFLLITGARREDLEASEHFYAGHDVLHKPFTLRQFWLSFEAVMEENP